MVSSKVKQVGSQSRDAALSLLQLTKEVSPLFPPLQIGVTTALWIIETVTNFKSNKDDWARLSVYISDCMGDIAKSFRGNVSRDIASDIEPLNKALKKVQEDVTLLVNRSVFARIAQSREDPKKIEAIRKELEAVFTRFSMVSHITVRKALDKMKPIVKPNFTSILPPPPAIFHGRGEELNSILNLIDQESLTTTPARIVILGAAGMGKTSLALAVFHHSKVKASFGDSTYFVSCEATDSGALLVAAICQALKLPDTDTDPYQQLILFLITNTKPTLLALDNFETPWLSDSQSNVQQLLQQLNSMSHVTLLLTMRGIQPPMGIILSKPHLRPLQPLTLEAARDTFLAIAGEFSPSEELDDLLRLIDCVPLAVSLMGNVSLTVGSIALLRQHWETEKTSMMAASETNRHTNLELSIKLSINCAPMVKSPDALRLLSLVSLLPDGAAINTIEQISSMQNALSPLRILKQIGLAYEAPLRLKVLSPIRAYITNYHPAKAEDMDIMLQHYIDMAKKGKVWPGQDPWSEACSVLIPERGNLHSVLALAFRTQKSDTLVEAVLAYSTFLGLTTPNVDLIRLITNDESWELNPILKADCLLEYGDMLGRTRDYKDAEIILTRAKVFSESAELALQVASSLYCLGTIYRHMGKYALSLETLKQAKTKYEALDHNKKRSALAACLQAMGNTMSAKGDDPMVIDIYEDARKEFLEIDDRVSATECLHGIGAYYGRNAQADKALPLLEEALSEFRAMQFAQGEATCLCTLGLILSSSGQADEALQILPQALELLQRIGDREMTARCFQFLGIMQLIKGMLPDAKANMHKALDILRKMGMESGVAEISQQLASLHAACGEITEAEEAYKAAREDHLRLGNRSSAATCLREQALYRDMLGRDRQETLAMHLQAREELVSEGGKVDAALALVNAAHSYTILGRYAEAWNSFRTARLELLEAPANGNPAIPAGVEHTTQSLTSLKQVAPDLLGSLSFDQACET